MCPQISWPFAIHFGLCLNVLRIGFPILIYTRACSVHPPDFMSTTQKILITPVKSPTKSPIIFELSKSAMMHNSKVLKHHNYDINQLIASHPGSDLDYGSEFRPVCILEPLLKHHPTWDRLSTYLSSGFDAKFKPISEKDRLNDITSAIDMGNHQSARTQNEVLLSNVKKEINAGFQFPFLIQDTHGT